MAPPDFGLMPLEQRPTRRARSSTSPSSLLSRTTARRQCRLRIDPTGGTDHCPGPSTHVHGGGGWGGGLHCTVAAPTDHHYRQRRSSLTCLQDSMQWRCHRPVSASPPACAACIPAPALFLTVCGAWPTGAYTHVCAHVYALPFAVHLHRVCRCLHGVVRGCACAQVLAFECRHVCRRVCRKVCTHKCRVKCGNGADMCADMCADMRADKRAAMRAGTCADMCVGMCPQRIHRRCDYDGRVASRAITI